jgi:hypothetical protein
MNDNEKLVSSLAIIAKLSAWFDSQHITLRIGKPRKRKPNIDAIIKRAEKAGKNVTSITTDGITLTFDGADKTADQTNDLDKWMAKRHAN